MKYTKERAEFLVKKFRLSNQTLVCWERMGRIPDRPTYLRALNSTNPNPEMVTVDRKVLKDLLLESAAFLMTLDYKGKHEDARTRIDWAKLL